VPSLSISLINDTSLVSVITVGELMPTTKEVIATTFQPFRCTCQRQAFTGPWVRFLNLCKKNRKCG
jgi:ABC-type arginine transport system permease subunit